MVGLLLISVVGVAAFLLTQDDDSDEDGDLATDRTETGEEETDEGDQRGRSNTGGAEERTPPTSSAPATTAATTTSSTTSTTAITAPAAASIGDCVGVTAEGNFLGVGSCSDGGAPYRVVNVVDSPSECSSDAWYTPSGDRVLCMEINVLLNYCYVFPKGASGGLDGWITSATDCYTPGTVHVIDIVPGATSGDICTQDYEWNYWYDLAPPQMTVCVMEY